jgi:hypothetical protein
VLEHEVGGGARGVGVTLTSCAEMIGQPPFTTSAWPWMQALWSSPPYPVALLGSTCLVCRQSRLLPRAHPWLRQGASKWILLAEQSLVKSPRTTPLLVEYRFVIMLHV